MYIYIYIYITVICPLKPMNGQNEAAALRKWWLSAARGAASMGGVPWPAGVHKAHLSTITLINSFAPNASKRYE